MGVKIRKRFGTDGGRMLAEFNDIQKVD